jgi:outer membrane protein assembly factor BamD (BamD/ComL family)
MRVEKVGLERGKRLPVHFSTLEEKQFNKPHATKLYRQIVEEYPDSPYANQAKTRLAELEKAR